MKRLWMVVLAGSLAAAPAWGEQQISERHKVRSDVSVKIEDVIGGSLEIIGWGKDEVEIVGTIGDDVVKLEVDVERDRIIIRPEMPEGSGKEVDVDLTIKIPKNAARVSAGSVSASIEVRGVKHRVNLGTVSGPIEVEGDLGDAKIATVSGTVESRGKRDDLEVASVSGDVVLNGDTDDASVAIVSGDIQFTGKIRNLEISSVSGNVRVVVPGNIEADFEISTFGGRISDAFGHKPKKNFTGGRSLEFSTGSEGDVEVSSVSGNVRIEKM